MARKYNLDKISSRPDQDLYGELRNEKITAAIENAKDKVVELDIGLLKPYARHHFKKPAGDEWDEFVSSIKSYGILQPVIVRKRDGYYEIIAGHKRTTGAEEAGLSTVPSIIIECDDIDASVLVGLTNKQREHITDLEWGWTYRETYELLRRKAGRPKENGSHNGNNYAGEENGYHDGNNYAGEENGYHDGNQQNAESESAGSHDGNQQKTIDIVAEKYGVGRGTIQRKMRLTYLHDVLADMYEEKKIKQAVAIELSYLSLETQNKVAGLMEGDKLPVSEATAKELHRIGEGRELTVDEIYKVIVDNDPSAGRRETLEKDIRAKVPVSYIPNGLKKREQEEYIIKAVRYVWENHIEIE